MKMISKRMRYFFVFLILFLNITGFNCSAALTDWFSSGQDIGKNVAVSDEEAFNWDEVLDLVGCDSIASSDLFK